MLFFSIVTIVFTVSLRGNTPQSLRGAPSLGSMAWHYLGSPKKSHPNHGGKTMLVGGFNHLEKYESQLDSHSNIWKIKNVPNHQSECHKKEYMVSTNL
jgi:hypothetical protein